MYEPIILNKVIEEEVKVISLNDIEKFKIDINETIPLPEIILSICDPNGDNKRMAMTRQNISCVTAQAKVGKSFLIKLIVSACLKKQNFQNRLFSEMPEGRDKILYIDTEQSKYHVQLGLKQIRDIVGSSFNSVSENIDVFQFDAVGTDTRFSYVKELIYTKKYSFVVIDGISDLSIDTNDLKLADKLVTDLRIWATECDLHILNVIHLNPGDLSHKMKGHLGTKLADKSEIVLGVSIDKENANVRLVQSLATRNRKPDPFAFEITEEGNPNIVDFDFDTLSVRKKREPIKTKKDILDEYSNDILIDVYDKADELGFMYADLCDRIRRSTLKITETTIGLMYAKDFLKDCIEKGFILAEKENKRYFLGTIKTKENE